MIICCGSAGFVNREMFNHTQRPTNFRAMKDQWHVHSFNTTGAYWFIHFIFFFLTGLSVLLPTYLSCMFVFLLTTFLWAKLLAGCLNALKCHVEMKTVIRFRLNISIKNRMKVSKCRNTEFNRVKDRICLKCLNQSSVAALALFYICRCWACTHTKLVCSTDLGQPLGCVLVLYMQLGEPLSR